MGSSKSGSWIEFKELKERNAGMAKDIYPAGSGSAQDSMSMDMEERKVGAVRTALWLLAFSLAFSQALPILHYLWQVYGQ